MGKLILYELEKLFQRRLVWFVLAVLLFVNGAVIYREITHEDAGYSYADVATVYADLANEDEPAAAIEERFNWLLQQIFTQQFSLDGYPYTPYMETFFQEQGLVSHVYEQIAASTDYDAYLDYVQEQARRLTTSSLFADPGSFSYRNALQMAKVYENLRGRTTTMDFSGGVKLVTDWRLTDILILLSVLILVLNLLISEREEGTLSLIKSTKKGREATIGAKLITLALVTALLTLAFFGVNLVLAWRFAGLGDLSRTIQSLDGYLSGVFPITVGQYIAVFFPAKFLGLWTIGNVVFLLCVYLRNTVYTLLASAGVLGAEFLLWSTIDAHSWLSPLSQCNLMNLLDTGGHFANYTNMNLLGFPVNTTLVVCVLAAVVNLACIVGAVRRFCGESSVEVQRLPRLRHRKSNRVTRIHTSLLRHEGFKVLVTHKALLLLAVLILVQVFSYGDMKFYNSQEEYYYIAYSDALAGEIGQKQLDYLQAEYDRFAALEQEAELLAQRYAAGELSDAAYTSAVSALGINQAQKNALDRANEQVQILLSYSGEQVHYIYQTGWDYLLGQRGQRADVVDAAKLSVLLIMAFSAVFSSEHLWKVDVLLRASNRGKGAVTRTKLLLCSAYAVVASLIAFLPRFCWVLSNIGMELSGTTAHSVLLLAETLSGVPLALWVLGLFLCRCVGAILSGFVVLYLSHKTKNTITCILVSTVILLLPVFLYLLGLCGATGTLPIQTGHICVQTTNLLPE